MVMRSQIYIVPTNSWYIERTVWFIAGCVLLLSSCLAVIFYPWLILAALATGLSSILVALTGFCLVGNVLTHLGLSALLAIPGWKPGKAYFMQTDSWYLERRIYLLVGINISLAAVLTLIHSAWWMLFIGFVGIAMLWFAMTGFCFMANALFWIGAEPRLAPQAVSKLKSTNSG